MPPTLPAHVRAVVFDAYGTLFDVHSAVARHAEEIGPEAARLSELWRMKQLEYSWVLSLSRRYEPFWSLTDKALDHALARCPSVDPALKALLLDAYRKLDAYPEVAAMLAGLRRRGCRTAILSNGDPDMLAEAAASADIGSLLNAVLSVEAAGIFKTSPRAYQLALSALGLEARDIVFVSSNRWDVAGAAAFGFAAVWVNRAGLPDEYPELRPLATIHNLAELDGLFSSGGREPGSPGSTPPSSRPPA